MRNASTLRMEAADVKRLNNLVVSRASNFLRFNCKIVTMSTFNSVTQAFF